MHVNYRKKQAFITAVINASSSLNVRENIFQRDTPCDDDVDACEVDSTQPGASMLTH